MTREVAILTEAERLRMSSDKPLRVAIQGERGAFSHEAALEVLGAAT